jgi:hypothetical protein
MRALRPHTYHGKPQDEGDVYLAHEPDVENIEILKFAVRDTPPDAPDAPSREPEQPSPPAEPQRPPGAMTSEERRRRTVAPMTTASWPTPSSTTLQPPRDENTK